MNGIVGMMQPLDTENDKINAMIKALDSTDWATRSAAIASLSAVGDRARETLLKELDSPSMRRAVGAARILAEQNDPRVFDVMKRLILSKNPLLGQIAVEYLARYGGESATEYLINALPDSAYIVQISIVQALGNLRARHSFDALNAMLKTCEEKGSTLRLTLITALGAIGDRRAIPILLSFTSQEDSHMRKWAYNALIALRNATETIE